MSGPRVSARVQELEARAREAQRQAEVDAIAKVDETLSALNTHWSECVNVQEDFVLPTEWLAEKRVKRTRDIIDDDSEEEDSVDEVTPIPRFRRLKQNLYKAPLQRPSIPLEECTSLCSCKYGSGCGSRCHNRLVYMECVVGQCPSQLQAQVCQPSGSKSRTLPLIRDHTSRVVKTEESESEPISTEPTSTGSDTEVPIACCENTAIQTRTYPKVEVFQISFPTPPTDTAHSPALASATAQSRAKRSRADDNSSGTTDAPRDTRGYGLRLLEPVRKGTLLVEYLGEVITSQECMRRMGEYVLGDDFYFAGLDHGLMLDAKAMGSVARFANHSCDPSCLLQKWSVLGECRLVLVSTRDLPAGAEITYNYHYFDDSLEGVRGMKRQLCLCGAKCCSGTIGGRVTKRSTTNHSTIQENNNTRKRGRPGVDSARDSSNAEVKAATESDEEEYVSVKDMHQRCVAMGLIGKNTTHSSCVQDSEGGESSNSSSGDLTITDTNTITAPNSVTTIAASITKKYTLDVLIDTAQSIRACVLKATQLGLTGMPTTKFITNNDIIVCRLNALADQLETVVVRVEEWVCRYERMFNGGQGGDAVYNATVDSKVSNTKETTAHPNAVLLIDVSVAQELLQAAPKEVRIEQVAVLEGLVKTVTKAKRLLQPLCGEVLTLSTNTVSVPDTTLAAGPALHWDELIAAARLLLSALPLSCGDACVTELFRRFEAYSVWARQALSGVVSSGTVKSRKKDSTAAVSGGMSSSGGRGGVSKVVVPGLDSDSPEYEEYVLLTRLLDTYCIRPRAVVVDTKHTENTSDVVPSEATSSATTTSSTDSTVSTSTSAHPAIPAVVSEEEMDMLVAAPSSEVHRSVSVVEEGGGGVVDDYTDIVSSDSIVCQNTTNVVVKEELDTMKAEHTTTTTTDHSSMNTSTKAKKAHKPSRPTAPSRGPPPTALTLPLLADVFTAAQYYDQRLSVYMQKLEAEQTVRGVSSDNSTTSSELYTQWERVPEGVFSIKQSLSRIHKNKTSPNTSSASECAPLYCFCRLPEQDGESSVLTECSVCCNWYHPQCVNSRIHTLAGAARQKLFVCPLCQHLDGQVSDFAFAPAEWAAVKSSTASGSSSSSVAVKSAAKKTVGRKPSSKSASTVNTATADPAEDTSGKRKCINTLIKSTTSTPSTATTSSGVYSLHIKPRAAAAVKSKEYLTVRELVAAVELQSSMPVTATPVSLLLGLALKFCQSWQAECVSFLTSQPVDALLVRVAGYSGSSSSDTVSGDESSSRSTFSVNHADPPHLSAASLVHETIVLQRAVQLYLQLRLVRVRGTECSVLRQLAWIITVSSLFRHIAGTSGAGGGAVSVAELNGVVAGGVALFGNTNAHSSLADTTSPEYTQVVDTIHSTGSALLHSLILRQTRTTALVTQANSVCTREAARALLPRLVALGRQERVRVEGSFLFARIKCLCRTVQVVVPGTNVTSACEAGSICVATDGDVTLDENVTSSDSASVMDVCDGSTGVDITSVKTHDVEPVADHNTSTSDIIDGGVGCEVSDVISPTDPSTTAPLPEVYCWCRTVDTGAAMVCCDVCEEWFHGPCVGLISAHALSKGKKRDSFMCISCSALVGKVYAYMW